MVQLTSRFARSAFMGLVVCLTSLVACGGNPPSGDGGTLFGNQDATVAPGQGSSGVLGTKTMGTMTATDWQKLCDWVAGLYGGYGRSITCDSGSGMVETISGPASLSDCTLQAAQVPATCSATVAQIETCTRAISTCDTADDQAASAACAAMMTCVTTTTATPTTTTQ